jgi:hypothetical protein
MKNKIRRASAFLRFFKINESFIRTAQALICRFDTFFAYTIAFYV